MNLTPYAYTNKDAAIAVAREWNANDVDGWTYRVVPSDFCPAFQASGDPDDAKLWNVSAYDHARKFVVRL